jgi:hypothetical protein
MKPLLLSAVKALAQAPEEQAAALGDMSVDELALDLEAQPWHDELPAVRAALDELHSMLDGMSGEANANVWTREALSGPEWQRVRDAARRVLRASRD